MTDRTVSLALAEVVARADRLLADYEHTTAILNKAEAALTESEASLRSAKSVLEKEEANALVNAETATTHAARRAFRKVQDVREAQEAAIAGLKARVGHIEQELLVAAEEVRLARIPWADAYITAFCSEFAQTRDQLISLARKGIVIAQAVGKSMDGLEKTVLLDPIDQFKRYEIRPEEYRDGYWTGIDLTQTDATLKATFDTIVTELGRADELDYLVSGIKRRRRDGPLSPVN